jgi:hypothetical protein
MNSQSLAKPLFVLSRGCKAAASIENEHQQGVLKRHAPFAQIKEVGDVPDLWLQTQHGLGIATQALSQFV